MPASDFADVLSRILPFTEEDDRILLEPYNYLAQNSGKNVRSQLIEAFNFWLSVDPAELRIINKVVGMLHTSSLLMDDVEDSSVLRRGQPVAHLIYGVPQTINTANYVYFLAYQELLKLRPTATAAAVRPALSSACGSSSSGRRSSREDGNSSSSSSGSSSGSRLRSTGRPSSSSNRHEAALKADKDRLITPPLSPRPEASRVPMPTSTRAEAVSERCAEGSVSSAAVMGEKTLAGSSGEMSVEADTIAPGPEGSMPAKVSVPHRLGVKLGLRWDEESEAEPVPSAALAAASLSSSPTSSSNGGHLPPSPVLPHRSSSSSSSTIVWPTATSTSMDGTATPPLATSTTSASAMSALRITADVGARKDDNLDRIVTEEMLSLHRGQGLELFWRDSLTCPTEDEYVKMVLGKTGGLFRIAIKLMMAKSSCDVDLVPLVNLISIFFQIRDDYMNMQSSEYADNKNFAEDLTEGKFSFPIIHAIRENPASRIVINTLQKKPKDAVMLHHCVDFMRKETRSFEYTKDVLDTLGVAVRAELARVGALMDRDGAGGGQNKMLEAIIKKLEDIPV